MRHIISLKEQSADDILTMISIAQKIKARRIDSEITNYLPNKTLIMLFQKTSTRTRLSFEVAMTELGGHAIFLDGKTTQFSMAEFQDEIQAVMRYGHVLMFRAKNVKDVKIASNFNSIPVIDACSDKYHPAQALTDILTMIEHSNGLENIKKVVWIGIENNVMNTLMVVCTKLGIRFTIIAPGVDQNSLDIELNKETEATGLVERTLDLEKGLKNADYVHTDTWMNMEFFENGQIRPEMKEEYDQRRKIYLPYQLSASLIDTYSPKAKIMDCMPLHIGYEITRDAVNHRNSIIFDQAENRLHMQKGIIMWILGMESII